MTKNILLAATAVSVMAFAGAASAHTITFRPAGAESAATHIHAPDATGTGTTYPLAQEAKTPSNTNVFALANTLASGTLPSGNVLLTVELVGNAKFATAPTAASVFKPFAPFNVGPATCSTFTAAASVAPTATTATFIISNSSPDCNTFWLNLDVQVLGAGDVSVRTTLVTDGPQTPIDGGSATKVIISRPDAFAWTVDRSITLPRTLGNGAYGDTVATLDVSPAYTTFKVGAGFHVAPDETASVGILGTAALMVDTTAQYGLLRTDDVLVAHVTDLDAVASGDFSVLNAVFGTVTDSAHGQTATFSNLEATSVVQDKALPVLTAANEFEVIKTVSGAIPTSEYKIAVEYDLDTAHYNQETAPERDLEKIDRDGTNIIFPWMNSTRIQDANGSSNLIRLGNIGATATGAVFGQVLNTVPSLEGTGYVRLTTPTELYSTIAARGERVVNTTLLTDKLGDFGRGDVQISIEARPENITARRYATLANGSVTEFESGTVANDQATGGAAVVFVP